MEVTPFRSLSASARAVPCAARSARVFFTTAYLPPAERTALRSSKSWLTVSFEKVATTMLWTPFRSAVNFSTCSAFLAFVTGILRILIAQAQAARKLFFNLRGEFDCRGVERDPRSH